MPLQCPERFRVTLPGYPPGDAQNGMFVVQLQHGQSVHVIASNGEGWEHVSVSRRDRVPTWHEMCQIKDMFFAHDDVVIQFHPAQRDYVNIHPNCLHLWRPIDGALPTPPIWMV